MDSNAYQVIFNQFCNKSHMYGLLALSGLTPTPWGLWPPVESQGGACTQGFPMVFEWGPRGIQLVSQGTLHAGDGLAQDVTTKIFILQCFIMVSKE